MELTKGMLNAFMQVLQGANSLSMLAKKLDKSLSFTSKLVHKLEHEEFIEQKRNGSTGKRYTLAGTPHAIALKELLFTLPARMKWEQILAGRRLHFLAALSQDWITLPQAQSLSGVSARQVNRIIPSLVNRSIILKEKTRYRLNESGWPKLASLIKTYVRFSREMGDIKWKFEDEILFSVRQEADIKGTITGFAAYTHFGVSVGVISVLCHQPQKKVSKEEIFVHSLFEVDDPRTLYLALTFYLKNKLLAQKVLPFALYYGKYSMFSLMISLLTSQERVTRLEGLPAFELAHFKDIATLYGVQHHV